MCGFGSRISYVKVKSNGTRDSFQKQFNILKFCNDLMFIAAQTVVFEECSGFIFIQTEVFCFLKPKVLFINEAIELKKCFICKSDAPVMKSITMNHCDHRVRKIQSLLRLWLVCGLVSLNFGWQHV